AGTDYSCRIQPCSMKNEPARIDGRHHAAVVMNPTASPSVRMPRGLTTVLTRTTRMLGRDMTPIVSSLLVLFGGTVLRADNEVRTIVVTTSMIERATLDLVAGIPSVRVERLLPPASCPGHFDLSPRVIPTLRAAALVIRHSYQDVLEQKLAALGASDVSIVNAKTPVSLMIPSNYVALEESIAAALERALPDCAPRVRASLETSRRHAANVARDALARTRAVRDAPVIASAHQAAFCRWLGLDVLAEIPRPEDVSPREMGRLLAMKPLFVVGNLQEGDQAVRALGERLGVPVVILSNFPDVNGYGATYADLMQANIGRIMEAWRKRSSS
ncbi:MAG: zinc ABC transporter substrate-binding protein, partial [Vicinamibacteria bacterium]|nr:zinc ABC transporter substrate-binding protein [Vicinamibacteria bacterium]